LLKSKTEDDIGGVHYIRETFYVLYPGFLYDWYREFSRLSKSNNL